MDPNRTVVATSDPDTVFCTSCRMAINVMVSNAGGGLCPVCINKQYALAQQQQASAQYAQAATYQMQTGMGICPQCGSPNIKQFTNVQDSGEFLRASGIICAAVGVPAILICLLGIFLIGAGAFLFVIGLALRRQTGISRQCNYCGFRWAV